MDGNLEFIFGLIITIIMGLGWGSFATMATYRIPRGKPWIGDKPRCFMCKHELNIIDYFSIISYFIFKGKCRYCKGEYEDVFAYFMVEFLITFFFILTYIQYGFGDIFVLLTSAIVALVIALIVDSQNKFIPSKILISLLLIAVIYRGFIDQGFYGIIYSGIFGALTAISLRYIYFAILGKKDIATDFTKWQHNDRFAGPGFDYVKLLTICSIYLPISKFLLFLGANLVIIILWSRFSKKTLRIGTILSLLLILSLIF